MEINLDQQLTPNFTLRELVYGTGDRLLDELGAEAETFKQMVEDSLTDEIVEELRIVALEHENIRAICGNRPIIVTCGFRPESWEFYRGRSGRSQHTKGKALDTFHSRIPLSNYYHIIDTTYGTGGRAIHEIAGFVHKDTYFTKEQLKRTWTY